MRTRPPAAADAWRWPWRIEARVFWFGQGHTIGWCRTIEEACRFADGGVLRPSGYYSVHVRAF